MPRLTQTHTVVILPLSSNAFKEIHQKLTNAGYDHAIFEDDGKITIDMQGIGLQDESK